MKKVLLWFMQTNFYNWLLKNVIPYIRFTTYYADFDGHKYEQARAIVSPCDYILTTDDLKLTSILIPGVVDHAALVITGHEEIAQMTHHDFTIDTLFDICKESTRIIVMRCVDIYEDHAYKVKMGIKVQRFKGAKYDRQFTLGIGALYCSELVYQADYEHRIECDLTDLAGLGRPYISPTGLLIAKNCKCVYDSDYKFTGLLGCEIEKLLRNEGKLK